MENYYVVKNSCGSNTFNVKTELIIAIFQSFKQLA